MRGEFAGSGLVWVKFNINDRVYGNCGVLGMELAVLFLCFSGFARAELVYTMVFVHYAWMLGVIVFSMFSISEAILGPMLRGDACLN